MVLEGITQKQSHSTFGMVSRDVNYEFGSPVNTETEVQRYSYNKYNNVPPGHQVGGAASEDVEEADCMFLTLLPCELRVLIYKMLETRDLLRLRLTNQQIQIEINRNVDFSIKLDQSYLYFRRILKLRIRSCRIRHLTHMSTPINVFTFPARIKKLIFDGEVSQLNVKRILQQCSRVEQLVFTHETLGIDQLLSRTSIHAALHHLHYLTHLSLQLLRHPSMGNPSKPQENIDTFLDVTFTRLKSFKLYYSVWGNWTNLFLFLQRHVNTLRDMELHVGDRGDTRNTLVNLQKNHPTALLNTIDLKILKRLKLREFRFRDDVLHLNRTVRNIILEILGRQTELEILHFHSPGDMNVLTLKNVVEANRSTLKEVVIYSLLTRFAGNNNNNDEVPGPVEDYDEEDEEIPNEPEAQQPVPLGAAPLELLVLPNALPGVPVNQQRIVLDMSIFTQCPRLTVLALSCSPSNNPNQFDAVPIRLAQIQAIPSSVVRLHLTGFTFNRDEMVYLTYHLPNVKEILLSDTGKMRYAIVLSSILRNCPKLEFFSINPVKIRGSTSGAWYEEVAELNKLFQRFLHINYDPIDEMNGFEARLTDDDREWIRLNVLPDSSKPTQIVNLPL